MAPIPLKSIVSVSSEVSSALYFPLPCLLMFLTTHPSPLSPCVYMCLKDPSDPASNLLAPVHGGKWLCQTGNKSRIAEVVVELSKRARIAALEISE